MGLYDRVIYPGYCDGCGKSITEYQTTDLREPAVLGVSLRNHRNNLARVRTFYTICYCGTDIQYERIDGDKFGKSVIVPEKIRQRHGHAPPSYPDGKGPEEN